MELKVKGTEYKVRFGYNSFCDTDLMDRTKDLLGIFDSEEVENDSDVGGIGKVKELFCCVRDLLYVGFQKENPVESVQEVGDILDDYHDESPDKGILDLFTQLTEELMSKGFLGDLLNQIGETEEASEKVTKLPQDHKKPQKK